MIFIKKKVFIDIWTLNMNDVCIYVYMINSESEIIILINKIAEWKNKEKIGLSLMLGA